MANKVIYRHPDDPDLKSSLNDFLEFKYSSCWLDIKDFLEGRIEIIRKKLERAENMEEVRGYQESLNQVRDLLDLPELFIEELEIEKEQKEQDKSESK